MSEVHDAERFPRLPEHRQGPTNSRYIQRKLGRVLWCGRLNRRTNWYSRRLKTSDYWGKSKLGAWMYPCPCSNKPVPAVYCLCSGKDITTYGTTSRILKHRTVIFTSAKRYIGKVHSKPGLKCGYISENETKKIKRSWPPLSSLYRKLIKMPVGLK
ncbi:hypothetical protein T01_10065 [Trichinella spiralis]|uniref:Uncharacterized protein n=1 Tax=Trichinella spiralis TaxID=6334 RepID=A0A0V1B0S2_TRISP|nr:hypothetical protein T01_10065 [Trichinella spiralis]